MNQVARRLGRTIALVLPVSLVLSGTLAVTRVPWTPSPADTQTLTASSGAPHAAAPASAARRRPEDALYQRLLTVLHRRDPGAALTELDRAVTARPALAPHCRQLSARLARAAAAEYGTRHARSFARPVCDTSFSDALSG